MEQVQDVITCDFIILPCDLVCEMCGLSLLDSWMLLQGGFSQNSEEDERMGRRGGLGVWYHTKDSVPEGGVGVKKEETDFLATVELPKPIVPPIAGSLRPRVEEVVLTMPTAVLKDKLDEEKGLKLRYAAIRKHGNLKMRLTSRDAHIYMFPHWVKDFMRQNETFDSVGEDVLGWWAKAGWQDELSAKLGMDKAIGLRRRRSTSRRMSKSSRPEEVDGFIDVAALSSTSRSSKRTQATHNTDDITSFASRVPGETVDPTPRTTKPPPLLVYTHPPQPAASLLRRIDTVQLLLSASIFLAKLPPATASPSPFSHEYKVHPSSQPSPGLALTLDEATSLIDANVTLTSKSSIKESVVGVGCVLGTPTTLAEGVDRKEAMKSVPKGVALQRCLLMEGVTVGADTTLKGCVLGRRCKVGKGCQLTDCFVQEGYVVPDRTVSKGEVLAGFDGGADLDDEDEVMFGNGADEGDEGMDDGDNDIIT